MKNRLRVAVVVIAGTLLVGALAIFATNGRSGTTAGPTPGTYKIAVTLNTKQEVPKAKGTTTATGSFTGTLKVVTASNSTLTFKLTYTKLTGPGFAAHVHLGAVGKSGRVVVPLCGPCTSGAHGIKKVPAAAAQAMILGTAYVNVHTKKNPAGEIRGQFKAATPAGGGGGGTANPYANIVVAQTPALIAQGKTLSTNFSCEGCHTLNGQNSAGPTWKGLAGKTVHLTTGKTEKATDGYLIWSIEQPDAQIVAGYSSGIMTTAIGNISLAQAKALVAYIKSVK